MLVRKKMCYIKGVKSGFTLIEILVVIAILGILIGIVIIAVNNVRGDAVNTRIVNDVRQLRVLAEAAYDNSAASYENWSSKAAVQEEVTTVLADLTDAHAGAPGAAYVLVDSEEREFCISAPLHVNTGGHYCVDHTGAFKNVTAACPTIAPIACP